MQNNCSYLRVDSISDLSSGASVAYIFCKMNLQIYNPWTFCRISEYVLKVLESVLKEVTELCFTLLSLNKWKIPNI